MNLSRFVGERDALKIENAVLVYFDHWPWRFNAVETSTMKVAQLLDQKACSWPEHTCRATAMTPPACRIIPPHLRSLSLDFDRLTTPNSYCFLHPTAAAAATSASTQIPIFCEGLPWSQNLCLITTPKHWAHPTGISMQTVIVKQQLLLPLPPLTCVTGWLGCNPCRSSDRINTHSK